MTILNTSKLTFFKNEGKPLTSGYIYVGSAGLDPLVEANQKTVTFTDSAGTEATAPQPLRTDTDGRIQWTGKAITASVEGSYSLLILDSSQVQINGGWTPTVTPDTGSSGTIENVIQYGLTLSDVKELEVEPGDRVNSVGKIVSTDGIVASWLVISSTGDPADDIDLIDFENGLQGQRVLNYNMEEFDIDLDGDFTGGTVKIARTGSVVVVSIYGATLSSATSGTSSALIPASCRPTEGTIGFATSFGTPDINCFIFTSGEIYFVSTNSTSFTATSNVSVSYVI